MTLTLEKVSSPDLCEGSEWVVADQDALAEHVARVAVGQYRHVAKILLGEGTSVATVTRWRRPMNYPDDNPEGRGAMAS